MKKQVWICLGTLAALASCTRAPENPSFTTSTNGSIQALQILDGQGFKEVRQQIQSHLGIQNLMRDPSPDHKYRPRQLTAVKLKFTLVDGSGNSTLKVDVDTKKLKDPDKTFLYFESMEVKKDDSSGGAKLESEGRDDLVKWGDQGPKILFGDETIQQVFDLIKKQKGDEIQPILGDAYFIEKVKIRFRYDFVDAYGKRIKELELNVNLKIQSYEDQDFHAHYRPYATEMAVEDEDVIRLKKLLAK